MGQNADIDAWLEQMQSGNLSPGCYFDSVQALPRRSRPRAVQMMLHSLSGDQIYNLLSTAVKRLVGHPDAVDEDEHSARRERESTELLQLVVRCAPSLPGFRDIRLEDLLRHHVSPVVGTESGFDCVLGLIMKTSPAVDEVVMAFCDAGGDTLKQLLKWCAPEPLKHNPPSLPGLLFMLLR